MPDPEDTLDGMFKFMGVGDSKNVQLMLTTLVRNSQINILKQLRRNLDVSIKRLTVEGQTKMDYDENLDPFKILDIRQNATKEEVETAFKAKANTAHPDKGGSNEQMIRVNAAYQAIKQFRGWT